MAEQEQVKPLAPVAFQVRSDDVDEEAMSRQLELKKRKYIQCCGCISALLLIQAVVVLVLFFTVFHIQDPMIRVNSIIIQNQGLLLTNGSLGENVTLLADVSVKNPNAAAFKFHDSTTLIYYGGRVVGEGGHLRGKAKARRTLRRNVTVEIVPAKILAVISFASDIASGALNISSYTTISGRVKIMNIIKKNVVVNFNCSMTFRIFNGDFHGEKCRPELHF